MFYITKGINIEYILPIPRGIVLTNTTKRNGVTVNLTDTELNELDEVRNVMSRSAFVRTCIIAQIKRMNKQN